ncbi:PhzF family phenazine biosynthesis protein [Azotosporobacter soli]|uniref:PhzF family phenazine biosynthesis protein n=1 Tax=Azotosporobacter soli TaxID=3055040 RepID=UPI0031FF0BC8
MRYYIVDAFSDKVFEGNPAAVCVMEEWLPDGVMQKIAMENNLSETAFAVKEGSRYHLRWFTPSEEIDLCGHATLATAYIITNFVEPDATSVQFDTLSGVLSVRKEADLYELDFPSYELKPVAVTDAMAEALHFRPLEAYVGRDLLCVMENERQVMDANPDSNKLLELEGLLVHMTAKGTEFDCVSRSFAPKLGVKEDPVCGSGHCHIIPFWSKRLNKRKLVARQASARGGTLYCEDKGDRVALRGHAVLYAMGEMKI